MRLAWERLLTGFPVEHNGLPTYLAYCCFDAQTLRGGDAAVAGARALARHVRPGDAVRSPWPFRVVAETASCARSTAPASA